MASTSRTPRAFTPQQRQDYVERFRRSGLCQAEFCRRAKIHPMTFSLWRCRAEGRVPTFAQVQVAPAMPAAGATATLRLPSGASLEVSVGAEAHWHGLGLLLRTLQA